MDDKFLIKQVLAGNKNAFKFLVLRYERPLFFFLRRYGCPGQEIEELAQEAFLKAYRNLASYDDGLGATFASWLFTIARNLAIDSLRSRRRRAEQSQAFRAAQSAESLGNPEVLALDRLENGRLRAAIQQLPEEFKSAVVLSCIKELTLDEIAATERCAIGTVKSRIFRGKRMLAALLNSSKGELQNGQ